MKTRLAILLLTAALAGANLDWAQSSSASSQDQAVRDRGKQLFSSKCAQCHDVDASKKLPDGTTLLARLAVNKDPRARLMTRLNKISDEDARAVIFYVEELVAHYRAGQKTSADPPKN
jgi:mono/diheme cytochrome c family protein